MVYTRKQTVATFSVIYLIGVTALAGYSSSRTGKLSIPISLVLQGFTTSLPIFAGLILETGYDLTRRGEKRKRLARGQQTPRPPLIIVANTLIFIYSSVVITLLGTHAAPQGGLNCSLEERWTSMFRQKNVEAIRTIQETFRCCGLMNSHDRAWPFPDKTHKADACERQFERTTGCIGAWRAEEQRIAGMLMAVVGLVFVWQFAIIIIPTNNTAWLHRVLPDRVSRMIADEEQAPRRAIVYHHVTNGYRDNPVTDAADDSDEEETVRGLSIEGSATQNRGLNAQADGGDDHDRVPEEHLHNAWRTRSSD